MCFDSCSWCFTPTCTENHIPILLENLVKLKRKTTVVLIIIVKYQRCLCAQCLGQIAFRDVKATGKEPPIGVCIRWWSSIQPEIRFVSGCNRTRKELEPLDTQLRSPRPPGEVCGQGSGQGGSGVEGSSKVVAVVEQEAVISKSKAVRDSNRIADSGG